MNHLTSEKKTVGIETIKDYFEEGGNISGKTKEEKAVFAALDELISRTKRTAEKELPEKEKELEMLKSNLIAILDKDSGSTLYIHPSAEKITKDSFQLLIVGNGSSHGIYGGVSYVGDKKLNMKNIRLKMHKVVFDIPVEPYYLIEESRGEKVNERYNFILDSTQLWVVRRGIKSGDLEITIEGEEKDVDISISENELQATIEVLEVYDAMREVEYLKELSADQEE
ncbi:hypothetical protein KB559_02860 [Paenibacillus sp. Marseille-P2973]|uniref:hypothetical protein n=1 Tax=Paenibacillus sp. Marseille-P2973 TaxID=1871032 RepID=UPI001B378079|nr:hypothetical protein [Paenibacillus sp. Marseille-P2973]MBQ4897782.1 hypothetical protein [Paenibacillus sp. Marseille-P2973]